MKSILEYKFKYPTYFDLSTYRTPGESWIMLAMR